MGSQIIPRSLDQRLEGTGGKGGLRSNPPDQPLWIPEDNPLLQAWNMTVSEYCQTVRRVTGLDLRPACRQTFSAAWPGLDGEGVGLIFLLGNAYRRLQAGNGQPEPDGYTPDPNPPQVWIRWETGPAEPGRPVPSGIHLASALACLLFMPFARMEERKNNGRGKTPGKDGNA